MMTAKEVRVALIALNGRQIEALAESAAVPVPTIYKVRNGETADPRSSTVEKLSPVLEGWALIEGSEGQAVPPAATCELVKAAG